MLRDVSLDTDTVSQNFARRIDIAAEISVSMQTKIADPRVRLENFSLGPDLGLDGFVSFNTADRFTADVIAAAAAIPSDVIGGGHRRRDSPLTSSTSMARTPASTLDA